MLICGTILLAHDSLKIMQNYDTFLQFWGGGMNIKTKQCKLDPMLETEF